MLSYSFINSYIYFISGIGVLVLVGWIFLVTVWLLGKLVPWFKVWLGVGIWLATTFKDWLACLTTCWFGWLETTDWPVFWTVTCGVTEGDATWFGMGASTFVCTGGVFGDWLGILFFCFNNSGIFDWDRSLLLLRRDASSRQLHSSGFRREYHSKRKRYALWDAHTTSSDRHSEYQGSSESSLQSDPS